MNTRDSPVSLLESTVVDPKHAFPTLTAAQIGRMAARGRRRPIGHLFVMAGAVPNTSWIDGCVILDEKGFVKTGTDLSLEELACAKWPLARAPYLLETSRPGIFAVGDVRSGNVKRVASAVGEGSIAVAFVHQVLHQ
jgi:thioredoxin reductase (NADPH)